MDFLCNSRTLDKVEFQSEEKIARVGVPSLSALFVSQGRPDKRIVQQQLRRQFYS
jgi:hypothetical protein